MTNRKKLLSHSEYDTLLKMNNEALKQSKQTVCVLSILCGRDFAIARCHNGFDYFCEECIQKWLNEEAE